MSLPYIVIGILGVALLILVHEGGHFLAARFFGLRVTKFSIGFGPAIYKKQPKGSATTYQIAVIPFLSYVQVDGMNPFEESDPADKASYANAPVHARISTIFAGSFANYLAASVLFFVAFMVGGQERTTTSVEVMEKSAAAKGMMLSGDRIVEIGGSTIDEWSQIRPLIVKRGGVRVPVTVERDGKRVTLHITPDGTPEKEDGHIGVRSITETVPVPVSDAALLAVKRPPQIVYRVVADLLLVIRLKVKPGFIGPLGLVDQLAKVAKSGFADYTGFLGVISAVLAAVNLIPIPGLDGARLMFLGYEAATRRRANARIEAHIHAVGILLLLALVAFVTIFSDIPKFGE